MPALLKEDELIRKYLKTRLGHAAIAEIHIERRPGKVTVTVHTGRPGVVIGKRGAEVDKLRDELAAARPARKPAINVEEIKRPELSAQLVADNIAHQLEQRISFRRAMKRAVQSTMRMGAQGIKVRAAGRLGGAEIARTEGYREGRVPLHTLRADIDYATGTAKTTFGTIGDQGLDLQGRGRRGRGRPHLQHGGLSRCWHRSGSSSARRSRAGPRASPPGATRWRSASSGLTALEPGWITNRQIEAARVAMTREMKRGGKVWIRIFPDKPITKKPAETRMGKGKGNPEGWVAVVRPGRVLFEVEGIDEDAGAQGAGAGRGQAAGETRVRAARGDLSDETDSDLRELSRRASSQAQAGRAAGGALPPAVPLGDGVDREPDAVPDASAGTSPGC